MSSSHPSDEKIQLYAFDPGQSEPSVVNHIEACSSCRQKAASYLLMANELKDQTTPEFDFDVAEMVLEKLPTPGIKSSAKYDRILICSLTLIFAGIAGLIIYHFGGSLAALFSELGSMVLYLAILMVTGITIFLLFDMVGSYRKQIRSLDFK